MALISRQLRCRDAEIGGAAGKEEVRDRTDEERTESVADQVDHEQHHCRGHGTDPHAHDALADGVLGGKIAVLHEAADHQADGGKKQVLRREGNKIERDRQGQSRGGYPGDGPRMLLVNRVVASHPVAKVPMADDNDTGALMKMAASPVVIPCARTRKIDWNDEMP
jgi:hypothetical protein